MSTVDVEIAIPRKQCRNSRQRGQTGKRDVTTPRIPRITRLVALAIKFQDMVDGGEVRDYADLARLGYVTRGRLTQIMNLLLLAPGIQEQIIYSERQITERDLRIVVMKVHWQDQWQVLTGGVSVGNSKIADRKLRRTNGLLEHTR